MCESRCTVVAATVLCVASGIALAAEIEHHQSAQRAAQGVTEAGQAAFAAVSETVRVLKADPNTNWSKVSIERLREHLVDMDAVFMRAEAQTEATIDGVRFTVTGSGRTLDAIKRMVPAHAAMMNGHDGWESRTEQISDGVIWIIDTDAPEQRRKLRALGFFGLLTLGSHHGPHHVAIARGEPVHRH